MDGAGRQFGSRDNDACTYIGGARKGRVDIAEDRSREMTMLFDAGHSLDERILAEQFLY